MNVVRHIEMVELSLLVGASDRRNPKAHDERAVTASIDRFGFVEPVVLDGRTGLLVSGHGRVAALERMREEGQEPPEGVSTDTEVYQDGTALVRWSVPAVVGWSSRSDAEAGAALIALNRTTERGGWDDDALADLLDELSQAPDGLDAVGFGTDDLDALRARLDSLGPHGGPAVGEPAPFAPPEGTELDLDAVELGHTCPACGFEFDD